MGLCPGRPRLDKPAAAQMRRVAAISSRHGGPVPSLELVPIYRLEMANPTTGLRFIFLFAKCHSPAPQTIGHREPLEPRAP
jgi:hypothetical protein